MFGVRVLGDYGIGIQVIWPFIFFTLREFQGCAIWNQDLGVFCECWPLQSPRMSVVV